MTPFPTFSPAGNWAFRRTEDIATSVSTSRRLHQRLQQRQVAADAHHDSSPDTCHGQSCPASASLSMHLPACPPCSSRFAAALLQDCAPRVGPALPSHFDLLHCARYFQVSPKRPPFPRFPAGNWLFPGADGFAAGYWTSRLQDLANPACSKPASSLQCFHNSRKKIGPFWLGPTWFTPAGPSQRLSRSNH
jgi:hypothetical protein